MIDGYRVAETRPEEIHTGATFAPGEMAEGIDPADPFDAAKIAEGRFVAVQSGKPPKASKAAQKKAEDLSADLSKVDGTGANGAITVADVERTHDNQEVQG